MIINKIIQNFQNNITNGLFFEIVFIILTIIGLLVTIYIDLTPKEKLIKQIQKFKYTKVLNLILRILRIESVKENKNKPLTYVDFLFTFWMYITLFNTTLITFGLGSSDLGLSNNLLILLVQILWTIQIPTIICLFFKEKLKIPIIK